MLGHVGGLGLCMHRAPQQVAQVRAVLGLAQLAGQRVEVLDHRRLVVRECTSRTVQE